MGTGLRRLWDAAAAWPPLMRPRGFERRSWEKGVHQKPVRASVRSPPCLPTERNYDLGARLVLAASGASASLDTSVEGSCFPAPK